MRPRSAHLSVWGLPTIKEGHEDHAPDTNQQDSLSGLSSAPSRADSPDDYLWSISQLARPVFCSPNTKDLGKQGQDTVDPPRHRSSCSEGRFTVTMEMGGCLSNGREYLNEGGIRKPGSLPPPPPLSDTCLRNSHPALRPGRAAVAKALAFPRKELKSQRSRRLPQGALNDTGSPMALQRDRAVARVDDDSIIFHWIADCRTAWITDCRTARIADCRTAWKEARLQARMLPAIAEI
ncbi:uncharacterized protein [Paramormyrops kingsleyae]|uniref:uncharacterized protein n=1 Tax=Paramormyrops kingsleyae TaxID=1676925 RepID=UPI000CD5F425|nr:uncharacterized protein LOC111850216 [Paramormyrops kingsleyae]XP_023679660.1 uncharacterized protein LOC111850216 [Paramormyrops kingsleyae]XP_023679665.1 uncharacterized protein LOC111850216 [Paramormyrops kingsleyae]